ncbi:MAG TPA: PKD domain-containing protein [Thermoplasmata archaeon]|nr:PKD domain-containing protein [Thermoplasmata archaeon]
MGLNKMKIKIISLLICTLFLTSIFTGITTAKNLVKNDSSVTNTIVDLRGDQDFIKITDEEATCDFNNEFVVYAVGSTLYIYTIKTGEIDTALVGGDVVFPKISENRVVYYDFLYMGFKMYNITTGEKTDLIVTNWPGGGSDDFQFYGDYIAYENTNSDQYSTEIFLYNIATGENIQLTDSPGEAFPENPCIFKNIIAWQLIEGPLADIFMYDVESENYTQVTNTSQFESETFPSIYENTIVFSYFYYDKVNGTILYGLKMYNIASGDETTIFTGEEPTANSPEIFGNIIVYSVPDGRLCLYNLTTNDEILIYESSNLVQPWNLNENYVLFTVLGEGVYLYIYNNNPPDQPEINGTASGKPGISYDYTFNAVDPNGNQVKYFIDWGDGKTDSTALNPSGVDVIVSHTWSKKGAYTIKAHAQDEYGLNSLDATLSVTMPFSYEPPHFRFFEWLLERFPHACPILRSLLGYNQ